MSAHITKYDLRLDEITALCFPKGSAPLSVGLEEGAPKVWFLEESPHEDLPDTEFVLVTIEEGENASGTYLGRFTLLGRVIHVFYREI